MVQDDTPIWQLTVGQLRELLQSHTASDADDSPVPLKELCELFHGTCQSFWRGHITAGRLTGYRLSHQRLSAKPSEARALLESSPLRPPKKAGETELGGLDAALASGQLVSRGRR